MSERWKQFAESVIADLRYALRGLRREPGYAVTAVLTLALGLGAVTAMLAVVDSVLLQPQGFPHPNQLVEVELQTRSGIQDNISLNDLKAIRRAAHSFSVIAGWESLPTPVDAGDGTRVEPHTSMTSTLFEVAGVPAAQGRLLGPEDAHASNAVVSYGFWRDVMHARHDVIGAIIRVNKEPYTVVGVLPTSLHFPENVAGPNVYTPLELNASGKTAYGFDSVDVVARLRDGVGLAEANAELSALWQRVDPKAAKDTQLFAANYNSYTTREERGGLLALLGACALLMAVACVNFANLQIARYTARAESVRVRLALGASRSRLLRQLATESVLLTSFGAGLGLAGAAVAVHAARVAYAQRYAGFERLGVHPLTVLALFALVLLIGVATAMGPAYRGLRTKDAAVRLQSLRTVAPLRVSAGLVVVEIALTCVLVITAGLMLRTFQAYVAAPLGFKPQHLTVVTLMPQNMQESVAALKLTEQNVLETLRSMPGINAVSVQLSVPFSRFNIAYGTTLYFPGTRQGPLKRLPLTLADEGYLGAMGIHAMDGRGFEKSDAQGEPVMLVNQAFAKKYLQPGRAVGRELAIPSLMPALGDDKNAKAKQVMYRVVGVVPDEMTGREIHTVAPAVYLDWQQVPAQAEEGRFLFGIAPQFTVRSALPPTVLEHEIRQVLKSTAPDMAVMQIGPVTEAIANSLHQQRLELLLASGFGAVALLLAAVGIYGVLAYSVAQRTREIGIRMALGSSRAGAMRLVARQAAAMVVAGLALGFAGAWPAGKAVRSFLFGVHALDALTWIASACVLLAVCAVAAAVPAWRAAQVDPMEALRTE